MAEDNREINVLYRTSRCGILGDQLKIRTEYQERRKGKGDLTLTVDEGSSKAHRSVLMEKSDYFRSMLSGHYLYGHSPESDKSHIDLSHCFTKVGELNMVLDFMYTGNVFLSKEKISCMLNAARLFRLTELESACSEFLMANLAPCTCISILILAEKYSLQKVKDGCLEILRAWFPFYHCHLTEALEIPPDCLRVLIKENLFELMPVDITDAFLKKWCERLKETASGTVPIPEEVTQFMQNQKQDSENQARGGVCSENPEDEMEEVLITLVTPKGSDQSYVTNRGFVVNCIEVLAFLPKRKTWKSILRHNFSDLVKPETLDDIIGITEDKVFLLLRTGMDFHTPKGPEDFGFDCTILRSIVSVDIKTKKECLIKLPNGIHWPAGPSLFLWGPSVCGFFFDRKSKRWSLYRNQHDSKCPETCTGDCWEYACKITKRRPAMGADSFRMKVYGNEVYVGLINDEAMREIDFFHISQNSEGKCKLVQLPSPGGFHDFDFRYELCCDLSYIYVDRKTSTLKFTIKFDLGEKPIEYHEWEEFYYEYRYTYDAAKKKWTAKGSRKLVFPEESPRVLEISRKVRNLEKADYFYKEEACVHQFFTRSSSPYYSTIWKVETEGTNWELVAHAPWPVDSFAHMTSGELRSGFLNALPNARYEDFSWTTGQSGIVCLEAEEKESNFHMEFDDELLKLQEWEWIAAQLWEKKTAAEKGGH